MPLADFFGAIGGKTIDYQSAPMQINHFCYMCYLPMPFSRRARFVLANDGDKDYSRNVAYGIDYERGAQFAGEKSRLHCQWHRSNPTESASIRSWRFKAGATTWATSSRSIRGIAAGGARATRSSSIDGKTMTHTPGTEDEYGSCWGFEHTYSYLDSGYLLMDKEDHRMYRWYRANPVRFQQSLKVEIQNQRYDGDGKRRAHRLAQFAGDPQRSSPLG